MSNNSLALTLSGGGLSALAYAGFVERLKEKNIQPTMYAGLSGGAISAVLLASNLSTSEIQQFWLKIQTPSILNTHLSKLEIIDHKKFIELVRELLPFKNFEDLPFPAVVFVTDLEKKEPVLINTGDIASAVVASCSVFPLLQPVKRRGLILGDGGFTVFYGAKFLRELGAKKVVGVDVTGLTEGGFKGFLSALYKQINASVTYISRYELENYPVDLNIQISFPAPNPLNFREKTDHLVALGQKRADDYMYKVKKLLN